MSKKLFTEEIILKQIRQESNFKVLPIQMNLKEYL